MQQKEFQFRWRPREELLGAWMCVRGEAAVVRVLRARRELGGVHVHPHTHFTREWPPGRRSWCRPQGRWEEGF